MCGLSLLWSVRATVCRTALASLADEHRVQQLQYTGSVAVVCALAALRHEESSRTRDRTVFSDSAGRVLSTLPPGNSYLEFLKTYYMRLISCNVF